MKTHRTLPAAPALLACAFSVLTPCQNPADTSVPVSSAHAPQGPTAGFERIAVHRSAGLFELAPGVLHGGGAYYDVRFDAAGMCFEPALGPAANVTQHVRLAPTSVQRGGLPVVELAGAPTPQQNERVAVFAHSAGVRERYAVDVDGVAVSWVFDQRPAGHGDLVVRYAVDTAMPGPIAVEGGGVGFGLAGVGGVTIGAVTGVDAAGRKVAGTLHCSGGVLEMSLPASFVDGATYPLVLDPLIATKFGIWNGATYDDVQPDCAYAKNEDRYLVTFLRTFSSSDVRVRGQLIDRTGGLFQGVIWITNAGFSSRARVASFSRGSRFGVVWAEHTSTQTGVQFRSVSAHGGPASTMSSTLALSIRPLFAISDVDIGSEAGTAGQDHAFKVVWDDWNDNRIYAMRIGIDASGATVPHAAHTVFTDSLSNSYSQPAIARGADSGGKLMVVARRFAGLGPQRGIISALVSARDDTVTSVTTIAIDSTNEFQIPDVDGYRDEWVVAWREKALSASSPKVSSRSIRRVSGVMQLGPTVTLGGSSLLQADFPSVGYSLGKTWLGYRDNLFGATSLKARGIDNASCQSCQDTFSEPVPTADTRIVTTTTMSGNHLTLDEGLIVWGENLDIWAQRVANHANSGTVTNLGGSCGAGGNHSASAPAIGRSEISCSVTGLSASAVFTMFNVNPAAAIATCGPCEWLLPSGTVVMPVSPFQNATFVYSLTCTPSLVGVQFQTQWTTYDPGTAPCAVFPEFALSDRLLQVIGQ